MKDVDSSLPSNHYSNSHWLSNATTGAPFIYVGDGSVKEIPGFGLGTSSYLPNVSDMVYMDMRTGEMKRSVCMMLRPVKEIS